MKVGDRNTVEATLTPGCRVLVITGAGGVNVDATSVHGETKGHAWMVMTPEEAAILARHLLDASITAARGVAISEL